MSTSKNIRIILILSAILFGISHSAYAASTPNTKGKQKTGSESALQNQTNATTLMPEVLSAKAFLEDLLVRRYSQELATTVERQAFTLAAQLELVGVTKTIENSPFDPNEDSSSFPPDLLLGTLDPEELLKKYAGPEVAKQTEGFWRNYRISGARVSVGLKETLNPEVKTQTEMWLTKRLGQEFGKLGQGAVTLIKIPSKDPPPIQKTPWEQLSEFQELIGQLALAFAILMGTLLWKLLATRDGSKEDRPPTSINVSSSVNPENGTPEMEPSDGVTQKDKTEQLNLIKEMKRVSRQIGDLSPQFENHSEQVMRSWCTAGDEGKLKLACFVEAVGKKVGKLPIPSDALEDLSKTFTKMPNLGVTEKLNALQKVYWDLLTVINLGPEAFEQPFWYLSGMKTGMINQVLMEENPKLKTLVSLYMPQSLRESYLQSLDFDTKRTLLETAAQLSEIPTEELKSADGLVKSKLKPQSNQAVIPLRMGLGKLVSALTTAEEITILSKMSGPVFEEFRRTVPSLSALNQWPDEKLSLLLSRAMPDEVTAYLRVCPELKDRFISLAPGMTSEVVLDELSRPDTLSGTEKNTILNQFTLRLKQMVEKKEVDLQEIFAESHEGDYHDSNHSENNETKTAA